MDQLKCPTHDSPLNPTNASSKCFACYEENHENKPGYKCDFCNIYVHEECINTIIPSRHKHSLGIKMFYKTRCCLCNHYEFMWTYRYHCSQCSFSICIPCARKPLIINKSKAHNHKLHQIPIKLSFICDACGLCDDHYPCICHQCCFIIHRRCLDLPHVIVINRHDHRISYVRSLGPGKWICGVCRMFVNGECGAYSCLICPNYVVHSKCATRLGTIWDGRELEGEPEEDESKPPFEVIDQNMIKHFSHEHNLKVSVSTIRIEEDALPLEEDKHCYACTLPLYSELCYKCTQCDFILHDACANLPRKKRHALSPYQLTLFAKADKRGYVHSFQNYFRCTSCQRYCTGFMYNARDIKRIDVRCASISNEFKHESHQHWLFVFKTPEDKEEGMGCEACHHAIENSLYLRCSDAEDCGGYILCFRCATLPTSVRHKYDDHPLSLHYDEKNVNSTYCCGICEEEIYSKEWFYRCNVCVSSLHTECVFKNLLYSRPGYSLVMGGKGTFDLISNRLSRPICYMCKNRCTGDLVLNNKAYKNLFICCSCGFDD